MFSWFRGSCVFFNGWVYFSMIDNEWNISLPPKHATTPEAQKRLPIWGQARPILFRESEYSHTLGRGLCPACTGPSNAFILDTLTHVSKLSPAGDWQRSRLVGWRGLSKMFLTELGSQTLPLGRQKLTGLTETTYCNMTIWMAKLQQHIFILITAAGILICWHPELLLCH